MVCFDITNNNILALFHAYISLHSTLHSTMLLSKYDNYKIFHRLYKYILYISLQSINILYYTLLNIVLLFIVK